LHVGNDIVDLKDTKSHHPRFAKRILNSSEHQQFIEAGKSKTFLWQAWAAKEASYKMMKQRDHRCVFSPEKFAYDSKNEVVVFDDYVYPIKKSINQEYVYCSIKDENKFSKDYIENVAEFLIRYELRLDDYFSADELSRIKSKESKAARLLVKLKLSSDFISAVPEEIEIKLNSYNIPQAFVAEKLLDYSISYTHHGRFVAVTIGVGLTD